MELPLFFCVYRISHGKSWENAKILNSTPFTPLLTWIGLDVRENKYPLTCDYFFGMKFEVGSRTMDDILTVCLLYDNVKSYCTYEKKRRPGEILN